MSTTLRVKPSCEMVHKRGKPYVREVWRIFDVEPDGRETLRRQKPPVDHGPFVSIEEAGSFITQKTLWSTRFINHMMLGNDPNTFPEFEFDETKSASASFATLSEQLCDK